MDDDQGDPLVGDPSDQLQMCPWFLDWYKAETYKVRFPKDMIGSVSNQPCHRPGKTLEAAKPRMQNGQYRSSAELEATKTSGGRRLHLSMGRR
jgi:hypothetical protein